METKYLNSNYNNKSAIKPTKVSKYVDKSLYVDKEKLSPRAYNGKQKDPSYTNTPNTSSFNPQITKSAQIKVNTIFRNPHTQNSSNIKYNKK